MSFSGGDVYISLEAQKKAWHVSLHKSGRWHVKLHGVSTKEAPLLKTHSNSVSTEDGKVGLFIFIPDSCLTRASDPDKTTDVDRWLPLPPDGGVVEVALVHWKRSSEPYPRRPYTLDFFIRNHDDENFLIGFIAFYESTHMAAKVLDRMRPRIRKQVLLDSPERRAVRFFQEPKGRLSVVEYALDHAAWGRRPF